MRRVANIESVVVAPGDIDTIRAVIALQFPGGDGNPLSFLFSSRGMCRSFLPHHRDAVTEDLGSVDDEAVQRIREAHSSKTPRKGRRSAMKECRSLIIGGISFVLVLNLFLFPAFHGDHAESDTFDDYKRCACARETPERRAVPEFSSA